MLTREQVALALPPSLKNAATQQLTDYVNNIVSDPIIAEQVRDNFISFTSILKDGNFKTEDYLHAVTYVSFKLMGYTNTEAYTRTFPQRITTFHARQATSKEISTYVSAYNKGKLVNLVLQQTMVPSWVLNQDNYQKAINVQVDLMLNANSEKVRSDAADSVLTHLKPPEAKEINLNLGLKENSGLAELKESMAKMAQMQTDLISNGVSTRQIAAQPIIEAEFVDVAPN